MDIEIGKVTVKLTAREWQLFSDKPGAKGSAQRLSRGVSKILSKAKTHADINALALKNLFLAESKFGATDSEPLYMLSVVVKQIYGKGIELW